MGLTQLPVQGTGFLFWENGRRLVSFTSQLHQWPNLRRGTSVLPLSLYAFVIYNMIFNIYYYSYYYCYYNNTILRYAVTMHDSKIIYIYIYIYVYSYHVLNVAKYCAVNVLGQKIPCKSIRCLCEIIARFS